VTTLRLRHFQAQPARGEQSRARAENPSPPPANPPQVTPPSLAPTLASNSRPHGETSLLPHAEQRIAHLFLAAPQRLPGAADGMMERVLRLAGHFPKISVAIHAEDLGGFDALLGDPMLSNRISAIAVPDGADLWTWVQDRFLLLEDEAGMPWLAGASPRGGDATSSAAARACGAAGWVAPDMPLAGGNVLAGPDTCFLGADLCREHPDAFKWRFGLEIETRRAIRVVGGRAPLPRCGPRRFEIREGDLSWREDVDRVIAFDGARQPAFHLDLFLTPAGHARDGRQRVLLGDPAWASALTGVPLPDGFPLEAFRAIDEDLRCAGYEVVRNPLPFVYFDDRVARLREWFYASANNCLVEGSGTAQARVFLPEYGFGAWPELGVTDAINAEIWQELGYDVVRGGDFLPLADSLGALNCVAKVLSRR
jgi:hypothetical protein